MRTALVGPALIFLVSLVALTSGCAEAEENANVESAATANSDSDSTGSAQAASNETGASVTLTSARSDSSRPSFLARGTRPEGRDLREMASWKARCAASDDAEACDLIARSRLR